MNIRLTIPLLSALLFLTACSDNEDKSVDKSITTENKNLSHQDREYQILDTRYSHR